MYTTRKKLFRD